MILTAENYYTREADMAYVSVSQYKNFYGTTQKPGCEECALAIINGKWEPPVTDALLIGSYVDAYFDNSLDKFKEEHAELFSTRGPTKGQLKAQYQQADIMIKRCERDELFMKYMRGDTQVIMTGEIAGVPVKIKIDSTDGHRITDLKTCRSLNQTYYAADVAERINFIEAFGYDTQGAVYQEIYYQNTGKRLPFYIAAVSKDKTEGIPHPRIAVIQIPDVILNERLIEFEQRVPMIQMLKNGEAEPTRCGVCDYCADTEILERPISSDELLSMV